MRKIIRKEYSIRNLKELNFLDNGLDSIDFAIDNYKEYLNSDNHYESPRYLKMSIICFFHL